MANPFLVKDSIAATIATTLTWFDQGDNGHDASVTGAVLDTLGDAGSEYNPFFAFNGTSDDIAVSDHIDFSFVSGSNDLPFSVEFIARFDLDSVASPGVISKGSNTSTREWYFELSSGKPQFILFDESANGFELQTADDALVTNTWYHIVATYDGRGGDDTARAGIILYVDGVAVDQTAGGGATYTAMENLGGSLTIGEINGNQWTDGDIALVRIWNRELSAAEVATQYNGGDYWKVEAPTIDVSGDMTQIITGDNSDFDSDTGDWADFSGAVFNGVVGDWAGGGGTGIGKFTLGGGADANGVFIVTATTVGEQYYVQAKLKLLSGSSVELRLGDATGGTGYVGVTPTGTETIFSGVFTATTTSCIFGNLLGSGGQVFLMDDVFLFKAGAVAEYRLIHTNSFSPFEFEKARFLPVSEPSVPRQISGPAGGGQVKVASLGDDLENFPFRINRVSSTNKTNFEGFIKDSTVDRGLNTFVFVDESAIETTVRWLTPTAKAQPLNNIQAPGGRFNLVGNFRKEIT